MAILGPLYDSNNGWYIVTTGSDGETKKVTLSSPADYYLSMGVMPVIGPEYIDLEDVDSEIESGGELEVEGPPLDSYTGSYQESPYMMMASKLTDYLLLIKNSLDQEEKELKDQCALQASKSSGSTSSNLMNPGPSTSSASISSNATKPLPSTLSGLR